MLVLVIGIGIILTYFIQSSKIFDYIFIGKFLGELRGCSKCLGLYIFLGLEWLFNVSVFDGIVTSENIILRIILSIIGAVILSLGSYYLVSGWEANHKIHYIK